MKSILVLGAGQLGSRHLQSIRNCSQPFNIVVVDPNPTSLDVARSRYEDKAPGAPHQLQYLKSIDDIQVAKFDAGVVATNADARLKVLQQLLAKTEVRNLLIEKILFTREADYAEARTLLKSKGVNAWVNLCMRMQKPYFELKQLVAGQPFTYRATGSNYGLITNAIHFLDHAVFLNASTEFVTNTTGLTPKLLDSKRRGFHELSGSLSFDFKNGTKVDLVCYEAGTCPILIEIFTPTMRFISRESENKYWLSQESSQWAWSEHSLDFKYQSQLTEVFVNQVLKGEEPALTRFDEACTTHLGMLRPLNEFITQKLNYAGSDEFPFT